MKLKRQRNTINNSVPKATTNLYSLKKFTDSLDMFGQQAPSFNINGSKKVKSQIGFVTTMICMSLLISFITVKFIMLTNKHNPLMSTSVVPSFYDAEHVFNFQENNFKVAIAVVDYLSREPKDDPEYVMWQPLLVTVVDGRRTERPLTYHNCKEEDYEQFHTPSRRSIKQLTELKSSHALICLDD